MTNIASLCLLLTLHNVNAWMAVNSPHNVVKPGGRSVRVTSRAMTNRDDEQENDDYIQNQVGYFETQFSGNVSIIHGWDSDLEAPCGEDCEQCDIPEEIKSNNDADKVEIDVMAYLGIKRAVPLKRPNDEVGRLRVEQSSFRYADSEWQ